MNIYVNSLLKFPNFYRFYQKIIRKKSDDYAFFEFIFKYLYKKKKNIKVLDICCGDSFILNYIDDYISKYLGLDNNKLYLNKAKKQWNHHSFEFFDVSKIHQLKKKINFYPDFIFLNGVIHHFEDDKISKLNKFIKNNFPNSIFLSVDPIKFKNNYLNTIMIKFDRGRFIRSLKNYKILMQNYNFLISDFFFRMNFKIIFHYRNFNLKLLYNSWKKTI
jgi:2-polyprenyl-3-methyl-5-hydroxy-6-metoxy-1,4-benzoquinol methylase